MGKSICLVIGTWIQICNLVIVSRLPLPIDQGFT